MRLSTRTPVAVLASSALLLTLAACGVVDPPSAREADEHAAVAATVMTRNGYPIPSNDAAWAVVGRTDTTTIDALDVSGTAWDGTVTLRITVRHEAGGWGSDDKAVRCYHYRFDHSASSVAQYAQVDCPTGAPLVLDPPTRPDLSSTGAARLAARLSALPRAERTAAGIGGVLTALYPPPVASTVVPGRTPGAFDLGVGYTGHCMTGTVPAAGPAVVTSQPDLSCRGG